MRARGAAAMLGLIAALLVLALAQPAFAGPCDVLGSASPPTPCAAAHSTTRALYSAYAGPLYQLRRTIDKAMMDIHVTAAGGFADAAQQDRFCGGSACHIWLIYDQSPRRNHLHIAPPGGAHKEEDAPVNATRESLSLGGHKVYAAVFEGGMGYRRDNTSGVATGDAAETMYMVASGTHYDSKCCFDVSELEPIFSYHAFCHRAALLLTLLTVCSPKLAEYGNAETNNDDDGIGTMEAVSLSTHNDRQSGAGEGPWILADLEDGMWSASGRPGHAQSIRHTFVTAMLKGGSASASRAHGHYAIKGGDAQAGGLTVYYDGSRPKGYSPMKKQGSIILGIGGDNSDGGVGTFYEGVIARGYTSDATDDAIQQDIVAAGYEK
eukprot:SAG22_NODE_4058_length_1402_cov_1.413661_1_plen_379_part_00